MNGIYSSFKYRKSILCVLRHRIKTPVVPLLELHCPHVGIRIAMRQQGWMVATLYDTAGLEHQNFIAIHNG